MAQKTKRKPLSILNTKVNNSVLKSIDASSILSRKGTYEQPFEFSHAEVNFVEVELEQTYEIQFFIKNITSTSQRVKLIKPKDSRLDLSESKQSPIAPGLSHRINIYYYSKEQTEIHTSFKVLSCDGYERAIPINVYPPSACFVFQPFINFGYVKLGKSKTEELEIANEGSVSSQISLDWESSEISVSPKKLYIEAKSRGKVAVTISPSTVGLKQGFISVHPKQRMLSEIEFSATAIEFSKFLINEQGSQIQELDVPPLMIGQRNQIAVFIINNTPKVSNFRISQKKGSEFQAVVNTTPEQVGRQDTERILYFSPSQGRMEPYSQNKIIFTIVGKQRPSYQSKFVEFALSNSIQKDLTELQNRWKYAVTFHFDQDQRDILKLGVAGACVIPNVKLSTNVLEFGNVGVGDSLSKKLVIQNLSHSSINATFPHSNSYSFQPSKIKIGQQMSSDVKVVFHPKKVGDLAEVYMIEVGSFNLPLKLFGIAKFNAVQTVRHQASSLELSNITGYHNQTIMTSDFDSSQIQLSIFDNSIVSNKDETLRGYRKHRLDKKKELEMTKIVQACKVYDDNKPMDYEFEGKVTLPINQKMPSLNMSKDPLFIDKRLLKVPSKHLPKTQQTSTVLSPTFDQYKQAPEYTGNPKNQNQQRTISRQLQPEQLRDIQVGPTVIQIDNIFLNSSRQATFHIINNNKQPISIQVVSNNQQVTVLSKPLQIIPASSNAGFKILFKAIRVGEFKFPVQYVLNGRHFFEFTVAGTVIVPCLSVSKTDLKFFFTQQDKQFYKCQKIVLKNNYDYQAKYKWVASGVFEVSPEDGIVAPHSQVVTIVKYNSSNSTKEFTLQTRVDQEKIRLRVLNGSDTVVKCSSQVNQCNCQCKPQELNFRDFSVCKAAQQRFVIKNTGRSGTVFKIEYPKQLEGIVQITPNKKHLSIDESAEVLVRLLSLKPGVIDSALSVMIRCGRTIAIPIKANIILPKVSIEQEELDFGSTPKSGTPALKTVTLVNESHIAAELELNLGSCDGYLYKCLQLNLQKLDDNLKVTCVRSKDPRYSKPSVYNIRIQPKSQSKLQMSFIPQDVMVYGFTLPLSIAGYPEPMRELQKPASCKGILNKLVVQPKEIDFKRVIIQSEKGLCKFQEIHLTNPTNQQIKWWLGSQDISPFSLEATSGTIPPNSTENIKITFYPHIQGEYSTQIQLFIDEPQMQLTHCYTKLNVKACSDFPCITFDRPYLILPVVPLGVQSRCTFQISNDGYQNLNLKHIIVQELSNIDVSLHYPNGSSLGITKKKIKVEAVFKHQKPLSFTLNIQFYDENNRVYTLPVSGTTDNSSYTIQEYFTPYEQPEIQAQCSYIRRFLNTHVCFDRQIGRFPQSMLQNDAELLFQVISFYSTSFDKIRSAKRGQSAQATYGVVDDIIRILKSEGALLNHIRPQMLLHYNDAVSYFKSLEATHKYYNIPWIQSEELWKPLYKKSWLVLVYQILKTYNTLRINGVKTAKNGIFKTDTRFSAEQRMLISWADNITNSNEGRIQPKPVEDFSSLMDCEVLGSLLQKFANIKILQTYGRGGLSGIGKKEIQKRCSKFVETLNGLGISTHAQGEDIERSNHRQMLLVIQQLYQILPNYLPKTPAVQFNCSLGQSVSKMIEITNPSKQTVSYWAKIQGSKDFQMESESSFLIQPKKSIEFKVKYMSNFSSSSSATITFIGKKDSRSIPATMVFSLKGQTVGKVSEKCIQVTSLLYEQMEFNVNVLNHFAVDGEFKVQLIPDKNYKSPTFFCFAQKVKIKKGATCQLSMVFSPIVMETHKCQLFFSDPNAGQFQYEVVGLVQMPAISNDIIKIPTTLYVQTPTIVDVAIPLKNDLLSKARKLLQSLAEAKGSRVSKNAQLFPKLMSEPYTIELMPVTDMITCSKQINLGLNQDQEASRGELSRKVSFNINMRMAVKEGVVLMTLKNQSKTDIRKYKVVLTVVNKPFKYAMEIRTNLFKQVTQPIPMINPTQNSNTYSVHLTQDSKQAFQIDCEKDTVVEAGKTQHVNLSFKPKTTGSFSAMLKMDNLTIGQTIEYELTGISDEPESIQLNYSQNAKESKVYEIKILNQTNLTQRYAAKLDLQFATGPSMLIVPPLSSAGYQLTICPKYINTYGGSISFEDEGRLINYKIKVDTRETQPIREYNLVSKQRIPTNLQVEVQQGSWIVTSSDPNLKGAPTFVSSHQHNKYKLTYLSGKRADKKAYVYFHNQTKGDFSYAVNISVVQAPEIKINPFKSQLGKSLTETIQIQNLQAVKVKVTAKSTNPTTFSIEPTTFYMLPKSKYAVQLQYTPSNLELETADIVLQSERGEKWRYTASGIGILPTYDQQKTIQGVVNSDTSTFVSFRNPFKQKIQVIVSLAEVAGYESIFQLIMKNKRVQIEPLGLLSIPIVFIPKYNHRYETTLNVYMNQRMSWKFIIVGTVVTNSQQLSKHFKFKCREKKTQTLQFYLPQLPTKIPPEFDEWTIKLKEVYSGVSLQFVQKVVAITPQTVSLNQSNKSLNFNLQLMAYKPFQAVCLYEIQQKNKCRWLSKVEVGCLEPEPDDEITVVADINSNASVSFKLTNRLKAFTKFNAYFTPESDIQLSVSPKSGDLSPYGRQGTIFTVTFTPLEYRKTRVGKLVIETDQSYWSYTVKGVLPHYSPPKGVSSIASRIH